MLDKLFGKDGALWRTGGEDDAAAPTPASATPAAPASQSSIPSVLVGAAVLDPKILEETRKATFEIPGSLYVRFYEELKNLEDVIPDLTTRIRAAVKTLRVSPGDIVQALSTTHRAALDSWTSSVARAKEAGVKEKVTAREATLQRLGAEDTRIKGEIERLQGQLQQNATQAATLTQEISTVRSEIEQRDQEYSAAIKATDAELARLISTLQSITS